MVMKMLYCLIWLLRIFEKIWLNRLVVFRIGMRYLMRLMFMFVVSVCIGR